jgi:hypothetical protein
MYQLSNVKTYEQNKKIACEPFPSTVVEKEIKNGMVIAKQKNTLQKLKVVFDSGSLLVGSFIWVKSEMFQAFWAKEIYEINEIKFILVPEEQVVLVEKVRADYFLNYKINATDEQYIPVGTCNIQRDTL